LTYEDLQIKYDELLLLEVNLSEVDGLKGLYADGCIAIKKTLTVAEKGCILAEGIGHHLTTIGDILDQSNINNRKQEYKARIIAYEFQIGLYGLIESYEARCTSLYMMADYLDVTEEFLHEALEYYKSKYGLFAKLDNYIIYFEPSFGVMKIL